MSCNKRFENAKTNFGCLNGWIDTFVTSSKNKVLFPNTNEIKEYKLAGYNPESQELVFDSIKEKTLVTAGTELRIWYGEDLRDESETDNEGRSCVSVYSRVEGLSNVNK